MKLSVFALTCAAGLLIAGCTGGPEGPATVKVTGSVSFDGAPVADGDIVFRRASDQMAYGGKIVGGKYEIETEPGEMKVEITARREVPGKFTTVNVVKEPVTEMYIPKQYNTNTELTAKIELGPTAPIDFDLKGK
ncbi:hypothetical protein Pan44_17200 [Caulifigura coniformis]|uniref:Carboxypeptidase regulatory-like domain-containing protein n=1 Tax=Caulifigura coniformis TaxID=2527983 RepID=A0A517SC28_9PLAN|nr:hypothetical protein [Caulifigura coniformis]QDT53697.1 hypothetical protein Pan44_17200 [Caulifigura coniformis]